MTRQKTLVACMCSALAASGCALLQPEPAAMKVAPVQHVTHGAPGAAALYAIARTYIGQNRKGDALAVLQRLLRENPEHAEGHNALGTVYGELGRLDEAVAAFRAGAAMAPLAAHIHSNLGYAYYLQGRYGEAIAALQQATRLDPGREASWQNLAMALARDGQGGRAELAEAQAARARLLAAGLPEVPPQRTEPLGGRAPETAGGEAAGEAIATAVSLDSVSAANLELVNQAGGAVILAQQPALGSVQMIQEAPNVFELRLAQVAPRQDDMALQEVPAQGAPVQSVAFRLEVSNGNGITGLAKRVGVALTGQGLPAARLTNRRPFREPATRIDYREGYAAQAEALSALLPGRPAVFKGTSLNLRTDVRILLGRDLGRDFALTIPTSTKVVSLK